jgi:phosphoenolpyruvate carboxylase
VVRAFSYFSHLANIAEDQHHIRRSRVHRIAGSAPREGSLAMRWTGARRRHRTGELRPSSARDDLAGADRPSHRGAAQEHPQPPADIAQLLDERDRMQLTPDEREERRGAAPRSCTLWQTRMLRPASCR